ncbi:hypothetical protein ACTFIR_003189 [Dictyostelium discoideum]
MRLLAAFLLVIYAAHNGVFARDHIVSLSKGESFELNIEQGDRINFHVRDNNKHVLTIQGESQSFANLSPKDSAKQQFNEAGEFIVTDSANIYVNKIIVSQKQQQDQQKWFEKDAKDHANKMAATKDMEKHEHEDLQNTNDAQNNGNAKPNSAATKDSNTANNKAKPSSNVSDTKENTASNKAKPSTNTNDAKPKTDETKTKAGSPKTDAKPKTTQDESLDSADSQAKASDKAKPKTDATASGNTSSTLVVNVMLLAASAALALVL